MANSLTIFIFTLLFWLLRQLLAIKIDIPHNRLANIRPYCDAELKTEIAKRIDRSK